MVLDCIAVGGQIFACDISMAGHGKIDCWIDLPVVLDTGRSVLASLGLLESVSTSPGTMLGVEVCSATLVCNVSLAAPRDQAQEDTNDDTAVETGSYCT